MILRDFSRYRCVVCGADGLSYFADQSCACCDRCAARFPIRHNILNTLIQPTADTVRELQGLALEQNLRPEDWPAIQLRKVNRVETFEHCLKQNQDAPGQYYLQTLLHFEQAVAMLRGRTFRNALEIGAQVDYPFLKQIRKLGASCHAVNIFFWFQEPDAYLDWPEKTLADMNGLPFRDAAFDLVVMSATSHHSPDLERTIREVHRVLETGGVAIIISDPIHGWLKRLGKSGPRHTRHDLIHENEYSIWQYRRIVAAAGFDAQFLFSAYYDRKLLSGEIHPGVRFARIGRLVSWAWRRKIIREFARQHLLLPAQAVFGFPLNSILIKRR